MSKVSSKRQATIPIDQCQEANIESGDEIDTLVLNGQITLVKKEKGAAKGILSYIKRDKRMSDEQSLQSALIEKQKRCDVIAIDTNVLLRHLLQDGRD